MGFAGDEEGADEALLGLDEVTGLPLAVEAAVVDRATTDVVADEVDCTLVCWLP